ncbi:DnaD domain protein [Tumebacillus sp. ITR2]|uniref:DnaD domain protein n=1 Tax=Tumebacillus amylolyticus TaxID=2801339 RepID=A0ABS1JC83_9BACL|nr:DnaD domain protein [Tumebacillus amylolyticus]MBL0387878.1 DnaD domain protein [Tumebacillus amylolyticus]
MKCCEGLVAFSNWLETNPLDATAQALWMHLFALWQKGGSPDEFVVANSTLEAKIGVTFKPLNNHRNTLIQRGLISYQGLPKRKGGKYRLLLFAQSIGTSVGKSPIDTPIDMDVTRSMGISRTESPTDRPIDPPTDAPIDRPTDHPAGVFLQEGMNERKNDGMNETRAEEKVEDPWQTMQSLFRQTFGRAMRKTDYDVVNEYLDDGMDISVIVYALEAAKANGADTVKYLWTTIGDWFANRNVKTVADYLRMMEQQQTDQPPQPPRQQQQGKRSGGMQKNNVVPISDYDRDVIEAWANRGGRQSG